MKNKLILPIFIIGIMLVGFASFYQFGDPNADIAPQNSFIASPDTVPVPPFPFPTLFNFNYQNTPGMNAGTVGAMLFNGKYYFNRWNGNTMYRYNSNGPGGAPGTFADSFTYVGSCRDLTTDGTYLYGGPASTVLYRIDPNTGSSLKTINLAGGGNSRAVAWDPNRKGFWNCNFTGNVFLNDTNGALMRSLTAGATISGKYGMGWDSSLVADSAFVWVWSQDFSVPTDTTNKIYKINAQTGGISGIYTINIAGIGIAGGAEVIKNAIPGKLVLLCNYQNYALVGYNLKNILGISEISSEIPNSFKLSQNYPNPFNPVTKINFALPKSGLVTLKVYDMLGKEVTTLVNETRSAGTYAVDFDGANLTSGIYFYKIEMNGFTDVKKMMLIK